MEDVQSSRAPALWVNQLLNKAWSKSSCCGRIRPTVCAPRSHLHLTSCLLSSLSFSTVFQCFFLPSFLKYHGDLLICFSRLTLILKTKQHSDILGMKTGSHSPLIPWCQTDLNLALTTAEKKLTNYLYLYFFSSIYILQIKKKIYALLAVKSGWLTKSEQKEGQKKTFHIRVEYLGAGCGGCLHQHNSTVLCLATMYWSGCTLQFAFLL